MRNLLAKKFAMLFAVAVLVALMVPASVMAADDVKNVEITKKIEKPEDVFAPKTTFTFEIKNGTAVPGTDNAPEIKAGIEGGVTFEKVTISSSPEASDLGQATLTLTDKAKLKINEGSFTKPGIYRYVVTEKTGDYKGMKYDNSEKYFDVYVKKNDNGALVGYSYAFVNKNDMKTKDDGIFINKYGKKDKTNQEDWLSNLNVKKIVEGRLGDKDKEFDFTIKIDGQDGEHFNLIKNGNEKVNLTSGKETTIKLKHDDSIKVTGLSDGDKYTVKEADYKAEGYKTSYSAGNDNQAAVKEDATINVTNKNDVTTPTGIFMTYGPYIFLVLIAGALFLVFNRKRKNQDDEI